MPESFKHPSNWVLEHLDIKCLAFVPLRLYQCLTCTSSTSRFEKACQALHESSNCWGQRQREPEMDCVYTRDTTVGSLHDSATRKSQLMMYIYPNII